MTLEIRRVRQTELEPWLDCLATTFLDRPDSEKVVAHAIRHWDLSRTWGAFNGNVVGTLRTWPTELTVPGGSLVPAAAVAAVSVRATHRRRGILRSMITAEHAAARERGEPIAALYAAEAPIYGRFGYGPATSQAIWNLDTRATSFITGVSPSAAATAVEFAPITEATAAELRDIHDRYRRTRHGEIARYPRRFAMDIGLDDFGWGPPWRGWLIVHRDAAGAPDGYARYTANEKWEHNQPKYEIVIQDLVALDDGAHDALWRFLANLDLVATIRAARHSLDERLPWILTNRRAAEPTDVADGMWLALLDVPAALGARTYERSADLVLEVIEPDSAGGKSRVRLEAGPEGTACAPSKRPADLTLHAAALGAAYLGGTRLNRAVLADGYDEHRPGALAEADALFRTLDSPRCTTNF